MSIYFKHNQRAGVSIQATNQTHIYVSEGVSLLLSLFQSAT